MEPREVDASPRTFQESRKLLGTGAVSKDVEAVAASTRDSPALDLDERRRLATWAEALRRFIETADGMGVLVRLDSRPRGEWPHRSARPIQCSTQ